MLSGTVYYLLFVLLVSLSSLALSLNQEGLYLQQAKLALSDPNAALSDWDSRDHLPCNWSGVTCHPSTFSVYSIYLPSAALAGPFPSILCRLPFLSTLSLADNFLNSSLPSAISSCRNLLYLDLSQNLFSGPIPDTLPDIPNLRYLYLHANSFSGPIPASFGSFPRLEELNLTNNLLNGSIPSSLGNVTTLKRLEFAYNIFTSARLPPELGNLINLEYLWGCYSNISGPIPPTLGRLKRLKNIDLSHNLLTGPIPSEILQLSNLVQLELYNNSLDGELPIGWSNMTALRRIDLSSNAFSGRIPDDLCALPLQSLNLYSCQFVGELPRSIAHSPNLYELKVYSNNLHGWLPRDLGRNNPLNILDVSDNRFSGELPSGLCEKGVLEQIYVIHNSFSGSVPASLGGCRTLNRIRLAGNKFSGKLPTEFWGLPNVDLLDIGENLFSGSISDMISNALSLTSIKISKNRFSGRIPRGIGSLSKLVVFEANDNLFTGSIPDEITKLSNLVRLDLRNNKLSGEIHEGIQELEQLNELILSNNCFSGKIPKEIGSLLALYSLDLSSNHFWGEIPLELQNLQLNILNLSYNDLSGDIPPLYTNDAYRDSFLGNPELCIHQGKNNLKSYSWWFLSIIFILAAAIVSFGTAWFFWNTWNLRKMRTETSVLKWNLYHKLEFRENEILEWLKDENIIGSGGSGKVYKATLRSGDVVAVKKVVVDWKSEEESGILMIEEEMLGRIRHKNIVRMWCSCSARGGEYKLLVLEYMRNGSVGDILYGRKKQSVDWGIRYRIALDVAEGLSYLHHDCVPPIVHRDIKSSNILLDEEFRAKIADFGVAKAVKVEANNCMSMVTGSCGYIAPEYAYTLRVNEKSDTYSFGVVVLELVTGRRAVDSELLGEKDLSTWVRSMLKEKGVNYVVDPALLECCAGTGACTCRKAQIRSVVGIGLLCTSHIPMNRPSMRRVVNLLQEAGRESG